MTRHRKLVFLFLVGTLQVGFSHAQERPPSNHPIQLPTVSPGLRPIPSEAAINKGVEAVKKRFISDYQHAASKNTVQDEWEALSRKLLKEAEGTADRVEYYSMVSESIRLATLANNAEFALDTIARLAKTYAVNTADMQLSVFQHFTSKDRKVVDVKNASRLIIREVQNAANAQRLDTALAMVDAGEKMANRIFDQGLLKTLVQAKELLEELKLQESQVTAARLQIDENPKDPSANLKIATFVGLRNGDWETAETYAVRVNENSVRSLFVREISAPSGRAELLRLAHDWWKFAETQSGVEKRQAQELAASRYETIIGELTGTEKSLVETRLTSVNRNQVIQVRIPNHEVRIQPKAETASSGKNVNLVEFAGKTAGQVKELVPGIKFRWCPPGKFTMGEGPSEVKVALSQGLWLGETEVTQGQWKLLMKTTPWKGQSCVQDDAKCPVVYVTYDDVTSFCVKFTARESDAGRLPEGWKFELPTEAQWEYACRAGTHTPYHFGEDVGRLRGYGWSRENALDVGEDYAHRVGLKKSNLWGLKDMHGNVWEWCADAYQQIPPGGTDPLVESNSELRVLRGGGWDSQPQHCSSTHRHAELADKPLRFAGFRLAAVQSSQ